MKNLKDFMLLFRMQLTSDYQPTEAEKAEQKKLWSNWIGGIAAQAKLVSTHQLGFSGKKITSDQSISEGIYISSYETVGGYMIIKVENIDEATAIAKASPILEMNGSVEVRNVLPN